MEGIVKIFKLPLYKSLTSRELIRSEKLRDPLKKIFSFTMKNQIISVETQLNLKIKLVNAICSNQITYR